MLRVIVCVRRDGEQQGRDLEVPAEVPAGQLAGMLAVALCGETRQPGESVPYRLLWQPSGKRLRASSTLADTGIWDGASLLLQSKQRPQDKVLQPAYFEPEADAQKRFWLRFPCLRVGRSSAGPAGSVQADLIDLKDIAGSKTVSREQARLVYQDGDWTVTPVHNCENQTILNSRALDAGQAVELLDGDQIQFGAVKLMFRLGTDGVLP